MPRIWCLTTVQLTLLLGILGYPVPIDFFRIPAHPFFSNLMLGFIFWEAISKSECFSCLGQSY